MRIRIVALQLLAFPAAAFAEIRVADAIEWTVADCDLVVRARFVRRVEIDGWPAGYSVSSYRVEDTLLGEPRDQIDVLARDLREEDAGTGDAEYLLFLGYHCRHFPDEAVNGAADRAPFELRAWTRLDAPIRAYTIKCDVITDRAVLLETVRREARRRRETVLRPASHRLEVPLGWPLGADLYAGSAVFLEVPVDDRLASLAQTWARAEDDTQRRAAEEGLRTVTVRTRTLERIAGLSAPDSNETGDLAKRLARAEAAVVALRGPMLHALETSKGGALEKALLRYRLAALWPGPEDRAAVVELFNHDFDAVAIAARKTLWPIVLHEGRQGTDRIMELCARIDGRVAFNVLRMRAWESGRLQHVTTVEERLYCFQDKAAPRGFRSFYIDLLSYPPAGVSRDGTERQYQPAPVWRAAAETVPADMEIEALRLSAENVHHWGECSWGAPAWAAPFLLGEFRDAVSPLSGNQEGEADPKRR